MRRVLAIVGIAALALTGARAGEFVAAAPLGSTVLDLDTADGNYSVWRLPAHDGINAIRTTLKVHRLGSDPRWAPSFNISFKNGGDSVVFRISSASRQPPLGLRTETYKAGKQTDSENFYVTLLIDQAMDVKIEWTADGSIAILAGGEKHTVALGVPVETVEFAASTGEVEYNPLEIGRTAP